MSSEDGEADLPTEMLDETVGNAVTKKKIKN